MFTRTQYLNKECNHREYYSQFVNNAIIGIVDHSIGHDRIVNSTGSHLNDIPLALWDRLAKYSVCTFPVTANKMRECGDYMTLSGGVCILKEAANQIRDEAVTA